LSEFYSKEPKRFLRDVDNVYKKLAEEDPDWRDGLHWSTLTQGMY
jgi:hypothetical protein